MTLLELMAARTVIVDGAMGTELQMAGLSPGESGDGWTLDHPDRVLAVHRAYRDSGCDVLTTNSFGANVWVMERYGYHGRIVELNREAARLAVSVAARGQVVLGDIGPSGVLIDPLGPATIPQLRAECERQARALLDGGAHGIVIETMSDLREAVAAVEGARIAGADVVVACLTFRRLANGRFRTMMGVTPEEGARVLEAAGAAVVGANCGTGMGFDDYAAVTALMRGSATVPVLIMPNAGQPRMLDGKAVYDLEPTAFGEAMLAVVDAGASAVGGCCGTTPAHIAALRCAVIRS